MVLIVSCRRRKDAILLEQNHGTRKNKNEFQKLFFRTGRFYCSLFFRGWKMKKEEDKENKKLGRGKRKMTE